MKKIISLVFALMLTLCLLTAACAETVATFPFIAQEYVDTFRIAYVDAVANQTQEGLVLEMEEGAPVQVSYDMNGLCTSLNTEVKIPLVQSGEANNEGEKFGYSAIAIMASAREIELNGDDDAILADMTPMIQGFTDLLSSFSDEDYENCISCPVTHEIEICTHPARITFSFDMLTMSLVMSFSYLP